MSCGDPIMYTEEQVRQMARMLGVQNLTITVNPETELLRTALSDLVEVADTTERLMFDGVPEMSPAEILRNRLMKAIKNGKEALGK